ncbi:hypothetical protein E2C01_022348 [Portunus trituberculatus]|uniref:Uncharacterized protein n=1 Tax=Portunus trituberculatus TaxID=210409 RepID=A0A5B7E6T6_PORTR|nr:hypothetical protein [Portunus trituberculatus]
MIKKKRKKRNRKIDKSDTCLTIPSRYTVRRSSRTAKPVQGKRSTPLRPPLGGCDRQTDGPRQPTGPCYTLCQPNGHAHAEGRVAAGGRLNRLPCYYAGAALSHSTDLALPVLAVSENPFNPPHASTNTCVDDLQRARECATHQHLRARLGLIPALISRGNNHLRSTHAFLTCLFTVT